MDDGVVTFAPVDQRQLRTSRRLLGLLAVLIVLQLSSAFVGISEAMFDHQPSLFAVLACATIASGWLVLAVWAGSNRLSLFPWLASIFWGIVAAIIVVAILAAPRASDSLESGLQLALLPLMFFAAVPLDPLGQLLPLEDQLTRCLIVTLGIFSLCLLSYASAGARARRLASLRGVL